jgi:hypothetical protein
MRLEHWLHALPLRLRSLFRRDQLEHELDEELSYHLDQKPNQFIVGVCPQKLAALLSARWADSNCARKSAAIPAK